jgi:ABC-type cobalamin/Fe3+-siderophores transport system ATPase subunit
MMKDGKIFAAGKSSEVLTAENIGLAYGVEIEIGYCKNKPYIIPIAPINH